MGSSGYRLIAGDKCDKSKGVRKDEPVSKSCSQGMSIGCLSIGVLNDVSLFEAQPSEGEITSQIVCILHTSFFEGLHSHFYPA